MKPTKSILFILLIGLVLAGTACYFQSRSEQKAPSGTLQKGKPTLAVFYSQG